MTQSTRSRLNDYEALLTGLPASNVIVNPINDFAGTRNSTQPLTSNYYQSSLQSSSYQTAGYCPPTPNLPSLQSSQAIANQLVNASSLTGQQLGQQLNQQLNQQLGQQLKQQIANHQYTTGQQFSAGQLTNGQQQFNGGQPEFLQPVSNSSTASTALLQAKPFQASLTPNGPNSQLITPPKLTTRKPKSNAISIWPINRKRTNYQSAVLNNGCIGSRPQLIAKLNRSSFTYHLLTCALITGIVTLLLIVISSICLYSSYANRVSKSIKLSSELELCTSIECHFGATCKVDANYKAPYCDCEQLQCDNSAALPANHPAALTSNRTQQLVCGSDDKTYTLCELKRAACWQQKRIEVQHYSACVNKKNADSGKISHHPNSKSASDKGKDTFLSGLLDADSAADVSLLINDPLAKQDACNRLACSYASSCQLRNVSLSSFLVAGSHPEHTNKKVTRLVCECPAKCALYDALITELVADANLRMSNQQQDDHYVNRDEYYSQSSSVHQSGHTFNYAYEQMRNSVIAQSGAVCGSNAKDYRNLCELAKASCASQSRISIKYFGLCDPCASHQCAEDEICKLKANRQPYCDCGHKGLCSKPQKHPNNNPEHVCGSDGNSYLNECVLRRHTCVNERNVTIISNSECVKGSHPCHKIHCNAPMECHVSPVTNQATCECSQHCSAIYKPVCGLDNRTYDSACHLALETCLRGNSQPRLGLLHQGVCGTNAISKSTTATGKQPPIIVNEEEHGDAINQLTNLQANGNQQCAPNTCPNYGICLLAFVNGVERITCECPTCTPTRSLSSSVISSLPASNVSLGQSKSADGDGPVCSSDGITFASECELRKFSCEQQAKHITIKHKGACHICKKCKHYSLCETTASGASECVCPEVCEKLDAPVCSSDGITFENECELRVHSCKLQKLILVKSVGPCNACEKIKCKFGSTCKNGRCTCPTYCDKQSEHDDLLCASNGRTFANDCDLKRYACLHQIELSIVHLGECEFGSTKKYNQTGGHKEDSVEAGVRLINDEEDEFNLILRQQSAEDESSVKNSKPGSSVHQGKSHHSNGTSHGRHHGSQTNRNHHHNRKQPHHNPKNHAARQQSALHRKQRSQLCRKLKCRFNSICKLDQSDLNQTKSDAAKSVGRPDGQQSNGRSPIDEENVELNRISLELIAYCDCSHINCDSTDREKSEELCGSDRKLYQSACQMKEKACKMQMNIHVKQRDFCDSAAAANRLNEANHTSPGISEDDCQCNKHGSLDSGGSSCLPGKPCECRNFVVGRKCDECLAGYWGLERSTDDLNEDDLNKLTTINKAAVSQANELNELDLLFDNYVPESSAKFGLDGGCLPCDCNVFGSIDNNCNQTTGTCRCKYGVAGDKCDYCEQSTNELTELGCVSGKIAKPTLGHCNEISCKYGAKCELVAQTAQCKCNSFGICGGYYDLANLAKLEANGSWPANSTMICGSNQMKYANECELKMHMCLMQEQIDMIRCL